MVEQYDVMEKQERGTGMGVWHPPCVHVPSGITPSLEVRALTRITSGNDLATGVLRGWEGKTSIWLTEEDDSATVSYS